MSFIDSQLAGKFKNVPFLVRSESLDEVGQSWVKHEYPKSGVQYFEPMGEVPFSGTIDLYFKGANYLDDFNSFKKAISDPAPGRLYSPSFGIFNNIIATPASFTVSQKTLGNISASVHFETTIDRPSPIDAQITEQDVASKALEATVVLQASFEDEYTIPETENNFLTGTTDAVGLAEEIRTITGRIKDVRNFLRKIDSVIRQVDKYAALLLNPGQPLGFLQSILLATRNIGAFSLYSKIANMGQGLPNSMNDIVDGISPTSSTTFESEIVTVTTSINLWDTDTAERRARNDSRLSIVNTFRMAGLIGMFESAANAIYTTTDEIDKVTASLELYYNLLVEDDEFRIVISSMKKVIDELKALTDSVLARKKQQAFGVIEIEEIRPISSILLAYKLYGEYLKDEAQLFFMASLLTGLNRSQPAHAMKGILQVVEIA